MDILTIILFGIVVLFTHFLEGITGFGCTVLALPFCTALAGIKTSVPVLVILAWLTALYIIIISFKDINWKEFFKIVSFVGLGLPAGILVFSCLPENLLKKVLGVFMIFVSIRGLYVSVNKNAKDFKINRYILDFILFLGGIIHGAFGTGGPFVVIYATKALPQRGSFRATLCALWFTLNSVIIYKNIASSAITPSGYRLLLWTIPFLTAGIILGNIAHKRVKGTVFTKIVYAVLLASGVFMLI